MAVTRIKNNQITDLTVNAAAKLQDYSVTSAKIANNLTYNSSLVVAGNLTVQGNVTAIDTHDLVVEDPLILLAKDQTGAPILDIGYIGVRGDELNIAMVWDESAGQFVTAFTADELTNTTITINSYASLQTGNLTAANGNFSGTLDVTGNVTIANIQIDPSSVIDAGNNIIANVAEPQANSDAATKGYVDSQTAAGFTIEDDTANTTVVSGGDTLELFGTANEVTVAVTANDQVTFGLPANVTISDSLSVTNSANAASFNASGNITGNNLISNNDVTTATVTASGNITGNNVISNNDVTTATVTASGNISGNNLVSNNDVTTATVTASGNVSGGNITTGGVVTATGNVSGGNVTTAGQMVATGNVTGGNIISNNDVTTLTVSASGNITGNNVISNNDVTTATVTASGNVAGGNITTGGVVAAVGNVSGGNITTGGQVAATGNVTGGNVNTAGNVTASYVIANDGIIGNITITDLFVGNITANGFANITGNITGGNIASNGEIEATANISGNNIISNNDVTTATVTASGNISGNNLISNNDVTTATVTASGNITGNNLISNNDVTTATVTASGNVSGGNITTGGVVTATGNVSGGNVITAGQVAATGNVTGGNVISNNDVTTVTVTASGNVTANNLISNNDVTTATVTASGNVAGGNITTGGVVTATGNVSGGNITTGGVVTATGNVSGGNVTTAGEVTATGNVTGGNITTAGDVTTATVTASGNVSANNVSVGNLITASEANITGNVDANNINTDYITATTLTITASNIAMAITGNIDMNGRWINDLADPVQAFDAATKQYVDDAVSTGLQIHTPVRVETPDSLGSLNATYVQGGNVYTVNQTIAGNTVVFTTAANLQVNDQLWFTNSFEGIVGNLAYFVVSTPNTSAAVLSTTYNGVPVANITSNTGLSQSVRVNSGQGATLTNAGANAALVIDGVTVTTNDRVLIYNQTNGYENGVYVVTVPGDAGNAWVLTRSSDMNTYIPDSTVGVDAGDYFFVQEGDTGAGESYVMTAPIGPVIIGYDPLTFTQFSASSTYSANTQAGLVLNGTIFSAKVDNNTTAFDAGGNIKVKDGANLVTPNIGNATGNSLTLTGNGLLSATTVEASGNVLAGNVNSNAAITGVTITASGNITGDNLIANNDVTTATVTASGNVTGGNITTGGTVVATGNVSGGNLVSAADVTAVTVTASGNVSGSNLNTTGQVTATGNISGGNLVSAADVTTVTVSATGNITGGNIVTSGGVFADTGTFTGNVTAGNITTTGTFEVSNISATGNITGNNLISNNDVTTATVSASGNITGDNLIANNDVTTATVTSSGNVTGGNIITSGVIDATGNITGGNLITAGDVSGATGTFTGNVSGETFLGNVEGSYANFTGNVTAAYFIGNIQGNIDAGGANTQIQFNDDDILAGSPGFTFDKTSNLVTVSGNVVADNLVTGGVVDATGNVSGGNITTAGEVSASGNVSGNNLVSSNDVTTVTVTASGNISGDNLVSNNDVTTATVTASGNITGDNLIANNDVTSATVTATGNVTGGNITTGGVVEATGNVSGGNITTGGVVEATGNISGGNLVTSGDVTTATVTASGNVSGNNLIANNDVTTATVTASGNVSGNNLVSSNDVTTATVTASGNVSGNNIVSSNDVTTATVTASGNISSGNITVTGISDFGNIRIAGNDITNSASNEITINDAGSDINFRVEGDNDANLFIVDAGSDSVLISTATPTTNVALKVGTTTSIMVPVGNTAQRPATGVTGMLRFNTTEDTLEYYDSDSWNGITGDFTVIVDDAFTGDGSTVVFTLSQDSTTAATIVSINGVVQIPVTAYSVAGNVLTFTEAPEATDVIDARILTTTASVTEIVDSGVSVVLDPANVAVNITGNLIPAANLTYNLGSPTAYWNNAYFAGNTIYLGNLQLKEVNSTTFGVFTSDGVTEADIDVGNIDVSSIVSGTSTIGIAAPNGNAYITVGGTANVLVVSTANITVTGDAVITGNVTAQDVNSLSDATLKTNINGLFGSDSVINQLRGVEYDWRNGSGHSYGFLAQEVEQILPAAVKTGADGLKSINYMMIIPFLVETIKQLGAEVADLKRRLD